MRFNDACNAIVSLCQWQKAGKNTQKYYRAKDSWLIIILLTKLIIYTVYANRRKEDC